MPRYCAAYGCSNRVGKKGCENVSFHRLPMSQPDRLREWIVKLRKDKLPVNARIFICSDHFDQNCFTRTLAGTKRSLKHDAVPTKFSLSSTIKERRKTACRSSIAAEKKKSGLRADNDADKRGKFQPETDSISSQDTAKEKAVQTFESKSQDDKEIISSLKNWIASLEHVEMQFKKSKHSETKDITARSSVYSERAESSLLHSKCSAPEMNNAMNGFSSEDDSRGDQICCLIDDGERCTRQAGNASYSKRIQKTVQLKKLKLTREDSVSHIYICDFHKSAIQSVRTKRKRKDSEDDRCSPEADDDILEIDFFQMPVNTLRRYKKHFKLSTRPGMNKAQLAETVARHFKTIPVVEKEALTYFIYMAKSFKSRFDQKHIETVPS